MKLFNQKFDYQKKKKYVQQHKIIYHIYRNQDVPSFFVVQKKNKKE